jgi:membrane protein implicated in regulation of membrane protease activity
VRISRGRLLLRVALLLVGGGFMVWRALETRSAALTQAGADRVLGERLALVMALVGLLALLTAAVVAWQSRRRERRHSLHLGGADAGRGDVSGPGPGTPPSGGP